MLLSHQLNSNIIHTNSLVIKDDVFLAQPSTLSRDALYPSWLPTTVIVDHDDTASLSSHSSLSSSQHSDKFTTSPCLSPVTSPTNFLYNHEPLFEGGIIEDLDNNNKNTSLKKDKKEELDQNKESISSPTRSQLIESVAEKDKKTVFQHLTEVGIDWCRYCGTTEGVNWRPGPWGKRTLCNKHGCDYKGYGLASRLPRLDLSAFSTEKLEERLRPVVQQFCIVCQSPEQTEQNGHLVLCSGGCSRAYHQHCHTPVITVNPAIDPVRWYCSALCKENRKRNKVVVELPRKHMPLMHLLPKNKKSC
ncbi:hypothetical protein EDC94DRAFT_514681 [Helicostylum pulchrum]|nr:hypothetical protein EDC94DRAFT_514681 [Helicostylum pulchrum]